ncbi:uncharacterized protein QYS62_003248 [Fusarium acuminatum]|uniref:TNT domain-containing protein n=1 Tax=Fusarium acuminatum TaxID=5515 RepID=A0ABZ2WNG0_9HYPO
MLPLGTFVAGYDRFGNKSPHEFLEEWWNTTLKEDGTEVGWRYPDMNGFGLDQDGIPIKANVDLEVGTLVDRFGNASGRFISPAAAPFSQRALHPQNLNTDSDMKFPNNYHVYNVTRSFTVFAGPIKPWFGQPGFGVQFFLGVGVRVEDHIGMKNLQPLDSSRLPRQGPPLCHRGENAAGEEL